jgi:hypothetical protein
MSPSSSNSGSCPSTRRIAFRVRSRAVWIRLRGGDPLVPEIAAAARAGLGDYKAATKDETDAIARAKGLHWDVGPLEERLARYRANQPWSGNLFAYQPPRTVCWCGVFATYEFEATRFRLELYSGEKSTYS